MRIKNIMNKESNDFFIETGKFNFTVVLIYFYLKNLKELDYYFLDFYRLFLNLQKYYIFNSPIFCSLIFTFVDESTNRSPADKSWHSYASNISAD